MQIGAVEKIVPETPIQSLPARLEQTSVRVPALLALAVLLPLALLVMGPMLAVGALLASDPSVRLLVIERPGAAFQVGLGLAVWSAMFGWPVRRWLKGLARRRAVEITPSVVRVSEAGLGGEQDWQATLASYEGLAHHIRASLSGTRHELVLVHAERRKSILVAMGPRIGKDEVSRVAGILGVREIPASELYRRPSMTVRSDVAGNLQVAAG